MKDMSRSQMFKEACLRKAILAALLAVLFLPLLGSAGCGGGGSDDAVTDYNCPPAPRPTPAAANSFDEAVWLDPPLCYHPVVRWWWPGGAVNASEIVREIALFREAGFGGIEIQAFLIGLTPGEIDGDADVRTVGTPGFFQDLRTAAGEACGRNMSFTFTLESGWPCGGPFVSAAPERQLLMSELDVSGPATYDGPPPPAGEPTYRDIVNSIMDVLGSFDADAGLVAVTAARVADDGTTPPALDSFTDITDMTHNGTISWPVPEGHWKIFAFYENRTNHLPAGAAYPGDANASPVADHLDPDGAQEIIAGLGDPMLDALGCLAPDTIFVDSFEMVGELPWTASFLESFRQMKGYDLAPYLPLMFQVDGESKYIQITRDMFDVPPEFLYGSDDIAARVYEDYEDVRSRLFIDGFVIPVSDWAHANNMSLRMQAHGGWAGYLDAYALADIPESEALYAGGTYDFLKLASSAGHTAGRTFISSESFVSIGLDTRALTLEDFYLTAGRAYSAGINRLIYHGYPYLYMLDNGRRWYPFPSRQEGEEGMVAAGPFAFTTWLDEGQALWSELPDFNTYLSRLSYAMSLGAHRADVAWLDCGWRYPDKTVMNLDGILPEQGQSEVSLALKDAGLVYDRVSPAALENASLNGDGFAVGSARYSCLLLTDVSAASPELMASIKTLTDAGVPVVVLGGLPGRAVGYADHEDSDASVKTIARQIKRKVIAIDAADELGAALLEDAGLTPPLTPADDDTMLFSLDRRGIDNGDVILLFNEAGYERTQELDVNLPASRVRVFDPETGLAILDVQPDTSGEISLELTIAARRSLVLLVEY